MTASLIATVFAASLVGSLHCVAMCGPLASLAMGQGAGRGRFAAGHALGRLGVYALLGALAGLAGGTFDLAGRALNVQRFAMIVAGGVLLAWGLYHLAVALGMRPIAVKNALYRKSLVRLQKTPPGRRAVLMGSLSGLLPCGWLWSFVILAAGTGNVLGGLAVMTVFWAGTVPALTGALTLFEPVLRYLRQKLPLVTAITVVVLGLAALSMRAPLLARDDAAASAKPIDVTKGELPACHGGH